ncbi:hypothetical protein Tco_0527346 [Tanacetum coccineum]
MKGKLNDPKAIEKKVNFVPIDYVKLNKLSETFNQQVELSLEQQYSQKLLLLFLEKLVAANTSTAGVEMASRLLETLDHTRDDVRMFKTASEHNRLKRNPRSFVEAMASEKL